MGAGGTPQFVIEGENLRSVAPVAGRKVLTSAAVTVSAIAVLAVAGLSVDTSRPEAPDITPLAESAPNTSPSTSATAPSPSPTDAPAPTGEPEDAPVDPVTLPDGPLGIPGIAMDAYKRAADRLGREQPACEMDWTLLAGIGQVESNHGRGQFDARGYTIGRILGPRLDGSLSGTAVIADSDGGRFDGDTEFDRAVGPVQFIPSTWVLLGRDGNDDGVADPNNIYDGALAAATLLCNSGGSMADPAARTRAILSYNNSLAYVANVNAWAHGYAVNAYPLPSDLPEIHKPEPTLEPPEPPEHCPEGWEGTPTAVPDPTVPGAPVPGCTELPPPPAPAPSPAAPAPAPPAEEPAPAPPAPVGLPVLELPCLPPFCTPPPA